MALYDAVRDLELEIESFATERKKVEISSEFSRVTSTVVLSGRGETGRGEDVTYVAEQHDDFPILHERGRMTLDEYSRALEPYGFGDYRRWAFESAALELALRQSGRTLGDAVEREYRPVRFVVSTRLEIGPWLEADPTLEFKLDPTSGWTEETIRDIAATGRVRVLDLKAHYGDAWDPDVIDTRMYPLLAESFPQAIFEDPATADAFERVSWDAPIHSVADIEERDPPYVNIKPSRFGTVERLFAALDHCESKGISMYGGGQFELGRGRDQIQALASLFYADAPNDVAPREYNVGGPRPGLPHSPLAVGAFDGF